MALDRPPRFVGKRVVITGAAGTLGRWLVKAFAHEGAILAVTDQRAKVLAELDADHRIAADGGLAAPCDLREGTAIRTFVADLTKRFGAPDILVNNAGVYPAADLLDTDDALWDRIFDVNLRATFILSREIARAMVANGVRGSIVNVTSGGARVIRPGLVPYCVAKGAVERLTKGFAVELGRHGIRVNAVEPGFMPGPGVTAEAIARSKARTPLGRHSQEQDAPAAILFLCSDEAAFITGATLNVDGGFPLTPYAVDASANANNTGHTAALVRS